MTSNSASDRVFLAVSSLLFVVSATLTIAWCASMERMGGMPMPGGWTMTMTWMRMPGQSWPGAAAAFAGMWAVMMTAMMLPSAVPALLRYRRALAGAGVGAGAVEWRTLLAAAGYLTVWIGAGLAVYPPGVAAASALMSAPALSRAVPAFTGCTLLAAGVLQFTRWKARQLAGCGAQPAPAGLRAGASALRYGLALGRHCLCCCSGLMAALLAAGMMDLTAMTVVTAAITAERVAPSRHDAARHVGLAAVILGGWVMLRAAGAI